MPRPSFPIETERLLLRPKGLGDAEAMEEVLGDPEAMRFIGDCGLQPLDGGPEIEVGYRLRPSSWGRGYATEAASAALRFGFEEAGLEEIVAVARPENAASRRVLEKIGMTYLGLAFHYGRELAKYTCRRDA